MGFESHVDSVIDREVPELRCFYHWCDGMMFDIGIDLGEIEEIVSVLNESGEFGPARFNEETNKIEFGVHFDFAEMDRKQYEEYWEMFIEGLMIDPW